MIFCGDLSVPNKGCGKKLKEDMLNCGIFGGETVVINLEGVLKENNPVDTFWKVYNDKSVLSLKNTCKQLIFNLANNHMYDYPEDISHMKELLDDAGILYFGLDEKPLEIDDYAIFGHCWEIYTKTNTNKITDDHVNDITYQQFYERVVAYINQNPYKKVICCFHWNFDMERFPFPAYKKLAHDLIDYGVEAVIGNHAHVVQEVEEYRGKIIAYGLGNYYMPDGYYFNKTLKYPESSHVTLTVDLLQTGGVFNKEIQHRYRNSA